MSGLLIVAGIVSLIPGLLALISINFRVIEIPCPILGLVIGTQANLAAYAPNYSFPLVLIIGIEMLTCALLMAVILGVVYIKGLKGFGGIAIGGIVGLDMFFLAFISGAPMNPARSLAPALLSGGIKQSLALLVSHLRGNLKCCFSLSW